MSDPINNLVPGQEMGVGEKGKLADANLKETENAHKLAAEKRAEDAANEPPLNIALADSIKEKLNALPPKEGEEAPAE